MAESQAAAVPAVPVEAVPQVPVEAVLPVPVVRPWS